MTARNRKGSKRETARVVDSMLSDVIGATPPKKLISSTPEKQAAFNEKWAHGAPKDNFSKISRVEVIDASGRVFSQHYVQAGVSFEVQDQGRTLKIFAGEPAGAEHPV